jgi:signal transduction histidine kinase/DNA-binding response OmpR family regulator
MKKITWFFMFFYISCFAQQTEISAINNAIKTSENFLEKIQNDSAFHYAKISQTLAEKTDDDNLKALSYIALANALYKKGKKEEAFSFGEKAKMISEKTNVIETLLKAYLILGNIHYAKFEDDQAITYYQEIETIAIKNNIINTTLINAVKNIGSLFLRGYESNIKQPYEQAAIYFQKAYDYSKKANKIDLQHIAGLYIGSTLVQKKEYNKALKYYDDAYAYFKLTKNIKEQTKTLWAYASLYRFWEKKELAEKYYNENIKINTIPNNYNGLARAHWAFAGYYVAIKNDKKAIEEYEKAIYLFKKEENIDVGPYSGSLYELASAYKREKNYEKAYVYLDDYLVCNDSINAKQNQEAFVDIEAKYQTEKKEKEIGLLNATKNNQRNIFLAILLFIALLIGALFYSYKNKIKTAQKLNELNELKSRFFANISHEFRTPLTLIKSPVQSLQSEIKDENHIKQLGLINTNSNRMLELVDQLLELSKIDSGNLKLILKEINVSDFINSIVEPFGFQAKEKQLKFKTTIEKYSENHYLDKDVVEKIVTNLLSNAFIYSPENEQIRFSSSVENENLKLIISNTGSTLKKENISKLFERFYQEKENQKGVGIGLALVKELVELYNGKIETSVENGVLSFIVLLPLEKATNAVIVSNHFQEPIIETSVNDQNELPILLIVDDNQEIRSVLKDIFKLKYTILEADNGETALKLAQKEIPDCIISDVMMPKLDGFQFTKAIKSNELTSFIPVVLLTAKTSDESHLEGLQSTADAFLTKPFNHEIVKSTVNQLILSRKKLQEKYSQELILKPTEVIINSVDEKFIAKLESILAQNLTNSEFTVDEFVKEIDLSRMQLHRKLKTMFGVSASEFIRNERLKTAYDLLKNKTLSVSEVAFAVGFNDISYFSKCFKEVFKITATDFQKGNQTS